MPTSSAARAMPCRGPALAAGLSFLLAVAGCSSDDDRDRVDGPGFGGSPAPARGDLIGSAAHLRTLTTAGLFADLDEPLRQALLVQAGSPVCDVALHKIRYATVGGRGEPTEASAALMAPAGADTRCTGARPLVLYAHGTSTDRDYDIADFDGGTTENPEGLLVAAFFAAQGYLVVAPNYAGYDTSTLDYHPYLVAGQQSADMIDALTAARSALPGSAASATSHDGDVFVTGYSQGGYVAMATQRALEAAGEPVAAGAPMSGPYALAAFVDAVFAGRVNGGSTVQGTFLFTAYERSFGDVYDSPGELFAPQYADGIETLFPSEVTRGALYDAGKLPRDAFFSTDPPAPEFAEQTPPTTPEAFAPLFAQGFAATDFLIRNEFRLSYLRDMQAHPDGFWPTLTTAAPAATPALPLRRALVENDLRDWVPQAPTLLCGGHDDPTVYWLNTQAMSAYWNSRGVVPPVTVVDVDAAPTGPADPYANLKNRFGLAKDLVAAQGGFTAVLENYHAGLVPPFCLEAVRAFFEGHR